MLTAFLVSLLLLAVLASPPTPRRIPPLIPALALVAVGFTALLEPSLALAQTTAPAPAAPAQINPMLAFILQNLTLPMVLSALGALAGLLHLSQQRKEWVGLAVYHAFHIVEDVSDQAKKAGKDSPIADKAAEGLKQANAYLVANGWRPLKPGEEVGAQLAFQSMNAQLNAKKELASSAASVVLPTPAPAPVPAAPAPTAEGSSHPQ